MATLPLWSLGERVPPPAHASPMRVVSQANQEQQQRSNYISSLKSQVSDVYRTFQKLVESGARTDGAALGEVSRSLQQLDEQFHSALSHLKEADETKEFDHVRTAASKHAHVASASSRAVVHVYKDVAISQLGILGGAACQFQMCIHGCK
eukprot:6007306-Pleurochrysis_carterae.AAC.1